MGTWASFYSIFLACYNQSFYEKLNIYKFFKLHSIEIKLRGLISVIKENIIFISLKKIRNKVLTTLQLSTAAEKEFRLNTHTFSLLSQ